MKKGIRRLLLSERGDSSYISSFVYILVVAIMIAFIINVFHIISVKQEMDHISDQLVKQIQLNGGKSNDTDALFNYLAGELSEVSGTPVPKAVEELRSAVIRHNTECDVDKMGETVKNILGIA